MKKPPLVSICCITYNHEKFIEQTLDSFLKQKTTFYFNIILGEDKSSDGTRAICEDYANKFGDKINLLPLEKNLGGRQNFLRSFKMCQGQYIALCEGDDFWIDKYKLQKQVDFLIENPAFVLIGGRGYTLNDETGQKKTSDYPNKSMEIKRDFLFSWNPFHTASILVKNVNLNFPDFFLKYNCGDWMFYFLMTQYGKLYFSNNKEIVFRNHLGGITKQDKPFLQEICYMKMLIDINKYFDLEYSEDLKKVNKAYAINIYESYKSELDKEQLAFLMDWI